MQYENLFFKQRDLPPPRILTCKRFAFLLIGVFFISAYSQADVSFNGTTFTGSGTYDQEVNKTSNLAATPNANAKITFSNNIVTTGTFTLNRATVEFAAGTDSSFGAYSIKNPTNGSTNNSNTIINGNVRTGNLYSAYYGTSYLTINDGAFLTVTGNFYLTQEDNTQGIVNQNGGTVSITTSGDSAIRIGHYWNADYYAQYNLKGGVLNVPNAVMHVGWDAHALLNISGGEANLKGINLSAGGKTVDKKLGGKGYLNLTGGTLNLGASGVTYIKKKSGATANSATAPVIQLGAGTVNALANHTWASNLTITLTGTTEETATVFNADSDKTITLASVVKGSGGLKKTGKGMLTLSKAPTYTGSTTIEEGTLTLSAGGTLYNLSGGSEGHCATLDAGTNNLVINNLNANGVKRFVGSITADTITVKATDNAPFQIYTAADGLVSASSFIISSGRIDVKGYMQAEVEVGSDATFSPGNSVGSVNVDGDFKLTGELLMEVDGTGADILTCDTFTMNGGTAVLNWQNDEIPFFSTLDIIISESTDLSDVYNSIVENIDFSTSPTVEQLFNDGYITVSLAGANNNIVRLSIDRNAVPEPSTWALLILGAAGLLYCRQRNNGRR